MHFARRTGVRCVWLWPPPSPIAGHQNGARHSISFGNVISSPNGAVSLSLRSERTRAIRQRRRKTERGVSQFVTPSLAPFRHLLRIARGASGGRAVSLGIPTPSRLQRQRHSQPVESSKSPRAVNASRRRGKITSEEVFASREADNVDRPWDAARGAEPAE